MDGLAEEKTLEELESIAAELNYLAFYRELHRINSLCKALDVSLSGEEWIRLRDVSDIMGGLVVSYPAGE